METRTLQIGDAAPGFNLASGEGKPVSLSSFKGRRVVLYFYPKDDTPGCTKEGCAFQAALPDFNKQGAVILGISGDDQRSHQRFSKKYSFTFTLLSDPGFLVCKAYGVYKQKLFYGKSFLGIERTTFVIDPSGCISAVFPKVKVDGHVAEVLACLNDNRTFSPASSRN